MANLGLAAGGFTSGFASAFAAGFKISLERKKLAAQERATRLKNSLAFIKVLSDPNATPEMKQFVATAIMKDLGVDKNSDLGKNMTALIKSSDANNKALVRKFVTMVAFASPEQKRQIVEMAETNPGQALSIMENMLKKQSGITKISPDQRVGFVGPQGFTEVARGLPKRPSTFVTVKNIGERRFEAKTGEGAAEARLDIIKQGRVASSFVNSLRASRFVLKNTKQETGVLAGVRERVSTLLTELDLPEAAKSVGSATSISTLNGLLNTAAISRLGFKLGVGISNRDLQTIQSTVGRISDPKKAIEAKLLIMEDLSQRAVAKARLANKMRAEGQQVDLQKQIFDMDQKDAITPATKEKLRELFTEAFRAPKAVRDAAVKLGGKGARVIGREGNMFIIQKSDGTTIKIRRKR